MGAQEGLAQEVVKTSKHNRKIEQRISCPCISRIGIDNTCFYVFLDDGGRLIGGNRVRW